MDLFPIGTIASASNSGTIDGISYSMFEPNSNAMSQPVYHNIITAFQNQTKLTRKKAEPFLSIIYTYDNIFQREYQQIEHFVDSVEDALNSFYTVDWSRDRKPGTISLSGTDWIIPLDNTRLFSGVPNKKANYAFVWNGKAWKLGSIKGITQGTSITIGNEYGNLSMTDANIKCLVYPVYCVYFTPAALSSFEATIYIEETVNNAKDGGWMRSGTISFASKYSAI